ncbi:MAG TPA: hypothetical protein VMA76_05000 [Solirubrobacteraceae bacterium]|nr:hypothetical protein [Solirubrobacteraceae bacterium]
MRWRVAALIALFGVAVTPGVTDAVQPRAASTSMVHVSVRPGTGSPATHFVISFTAVQATGAVGGGNIYRVTASTSGRGRCVSSTSAVAPPTLTGATVRVTLAPTARRHWCVGRFGGQVWSVLHPPCPLGKACPAIVPLPRMVGTFSFRVRRG